MKILIIEDERELAQSVTEYLSDERYLCETAATYQQVLDKIGLYHYDCILLDLMLPGGNGLKILSELKHQNRLEGVIIISAKDFLSPSSSLGPTTTWLNPFTRPSWRHECNR